MTGKASEPEREPVSATDKAQAVAQFCRDLVRCLKMDLEVAAREEDGTVIANLSGAERPILLSGSAAVLNSMEHLVNRVFRTGKGEPLTSIVLDSDKYRQHREAELALLAQMASTKVIAQGKALALQPMTPRERRIVHLVLAQIEGVRSESEGEGDNRSIKIHPK